MQKKIIQTCNLYKFGYSGANPGDTGVVDIVDCTDTGSRTLKIN